ncbi:MAG: DNA-binding CsgD family transcriptional regulator [Halieaceae bacterium]|jgi:DNA-binding CsgD family transcriptional regulator
MLALFSQQLAILIPAIGHANFPAALINMLRQLVAIDDATIVVYPGTDLPQIDYSEPSKESTGSALDTFIRGAFLLDPYYLAATRNQEYGMFRIGDLAPEGFEDSEYYKIWYGDHGFQDECGYLIRIGEEGFLNIALGKIAPHPNFSAEQMATLAAILPTIESLCQQHWRESTTQANSTDLRPQLDAALHAFGSSLLTDRETQVINLVLHGHSTKNVAERLSIAIETVKLHRKHAYAKLDINSQAELFYLFLDSVRSATNYQSGDTLIAYRQPSPR